VGLLYGLIPLKPSFTVDPCGPPPYQPAVAEHSRYQKKIIERYYDHRDEIMLTRLQEIATELFLAESDKKRDQLWKRAAQAMKTLKVPERLAAHILEQRKADILARNLRDWLQQAKK